MRRISKKLLDSLIYMERIYWQYGDVEILPGVHAVSIEIQGDSGVDWLSIKEFVSCIVRDNGLLKDASNDKIYEVLNVLGWEVFNEVKESESL